MEARALTMHFLSKVSNNTTFIYITVTTWAEPYTKWRVIFILT